MPFPEIVYSDFVGEVRLSLSKEGKGDLGISDGVNTPNGMIQQKYPDYTREFIGAKVYTEIESQDPLLQKWTDLLNGVDYFNIREKKTLHFKGLQRILIYMMFFEFTRNYPYHTPTGYVRNLNENSKDVDPFQINSVSASQYNKAIDWYNCEIKPFIENYCDFTGEITSIVDNLNGTFTVNTPSTLYLYVGDTVEIEGVEYTVDALTDNVSFLITTTSINVNADEFIYNPFEDVCLSYQEYIV